MGDREVSWGDSEDEFVTVSAPAIVSPVVVNNTNTSDNNTNTATKKKEIPVPEWSIDTRGDLPTERAIEKAVAGAGGDGARAVSPRNNEAAPGWPEEQDFNAPHPLGRRIGRDPVPRNGGRDNRDNSRDNGRDNGRGYAPREPREQREPRDKPAGGRKSSRMDDLSTLNLPGVDLSMMPSATTGLSFSNNNGNRREREPRSNNGGSRQEYSNTDNSDLNERVERVVREVEELGWGEPEPEPEIIKVPMTAASNSRSYEPAPVAAQKPAPVAEVSYNKPAAAVPAKIVNATERLDDDGWGDEPEEVYTAPVAVKPVEPVKSVVNETSKPVVNEAPKPVAVTQSTPAVAAPVVPSSTSPDQSKQADLASYPSSHGHSQSMYMPMYGGQMPAMPYMMMPAAMNSMQSPTMAAAPMSMMPGMMMPIWVTCPFCYHCYMYPPVAPGSGPAPGASTASNN